MRRIAAIFAHSRAVSFPPTNQKSRRTIQDQSVWRLVFHFPHPSPAYCMPSSHLDRLQPRGPALIAAGMAVVLTALLWPGVPIAAAVLLIGYGALLTVFARPGRQELLGLVNLAVYASLGCLAVAAQTHAGINGPMGRVGNLQLADHLVATVLLALLIKTTWQRLRFFSA